MLTIVFPGQGSQKKGMGQELFAAFPQQVREADEILGYSIQELCTNDSANQLVKTQFTQPALYVVGALAWLTRLEQGALPHLFAGHSLGEYNALFAADAFDFATGLKLVQKRGQLMSRASGGGMAAVLGMPADKIEEVLRQQGVTEIDIANDNSPAQVVISGPIDKIEAVAPSIEEAGARRCKVLPVSAAFHSRYMADAASDFADYMAQVSFRVPRIPVISNVTARPYTSADEIRQLLTAQMTAPVRWTDSMRYALAMGTEEIEELGSGRVLTGLFRQIKRDAPPMTLSEIDATPEYVPQPKAEPTPEAPPVNPPAEDASLFGPLSLDIRPETLGSQSFRDVYGVRYSYVSGAMYKGIASKELVVRMGKARLLSFLGTGGMSVQEIESALAYIQSSLQEGQPYGMNLLYNLDDPELENSHAALFLRKGVRFIEAAAYLTPTQPLVWFRYKGSYIDRTGQPVVPNQVIAKVSRPEIARWFLSPPPEKILTKLQAEGKLTDIEVAAARMAPISSDICLEADSGGHTDMGVAYTQFPSMDKLRRELSAQFGYKEEVRIGAAGGIGSPHAVAAAFILGADFVLTGSVNQCSVEAGTSDLVKDMLQGIDIQDTEYAPAGDMFEMGAKVQVLKKGTFFPARANKLYELYRQYNAIEDLDPAASRMLQEKYFKRSFNDVWEETKAYYQANRPAELAKAERNPKHKMALIFKWYFVHTNRLARKGEAQEKVSFQVHTGPALGAFNRYVAGSELENWRNRHVDDIAELLMKEGAAELKNRIGVFAR